MNKETVMNREQRKKRLLLQGAMHRLALSEARAGLKNGLRANTLLGLMKPGAIGSLAIENMLPLLGTALPLMLGKGRLSQLLRRVLVAAGAGALVFALFRRRREQATAEPLPNADTTE
jgi:hypothetical protein